MKTRQITLQVPTINIDYASYLRKYSEFFHSFVDNLKNKYLKFSFTLKSLLRKRSGNNYQEAEMSSGTEFRSSLRNNKKKLKSILLIVIAIPLLIVFLAVISRGNTNSNPSGNKVEIKNANVSVDVNKEFSFPLKDESGEEVGEIKYLIEKAELRDEIIVNGQKATSIEGRTFLIILLKVGNNYSKSVEINTRDYIRLSVNGNKDEWLAPDIHNDPVEVQAISTKNTRVGFPIYNTDKNLVLRVGEINGDKQEIELSL